MHSAEVPCSSPDPAIRFFGRLLVIGMACAQVAAADDLRPPQTLIEWDAVWHYHDGNEDLGDDWMSPDYAADDWKQGKALLGYAGGDNAQRWPGPGLNTPVTPALGTYYLRKEFEFAGAPADVRLKLEQIIDDAAVYYLNGVEIGRSRLVPAGPAGFGTRATAATNPTLEVDPFTITSDALREGRNVLAVSLHNHQTGSSDIAFAIRLTADDPRTPAPPVGLLLTWQRDPTTTMTIDWHRRPTELDQLPRIEARPRGATEWESFDATRLEFPFSDRKIDRVELTGLTPGAAYEFRGGEGTATHYFRTMPATLEEPLTFAIGGDVRHRQAWMEEMNRMAMKHDPEFIVWGGDLAYADGQESNLRFWHEWFEANMNTLVADDGRVPPLIVGIGNHEVRGGSHQNRMSDEAARRRFAPYFYGLFAFPGQPGYGVLDFGGYLSLVIGDTDHTNTVEGEQTRWLARALAEREEVTHLIPVYHVPAYPSHRDFEGAVSRKIREHWLPLFEQHGVRVAFENHDHTFKRTHPLRGGEVAADGIIFMGDGAWGVGERKVHDAEETWYLAASQSIRHGMLVTLTRQGKTVTTISHRGEVIDEVDIPVR